MKSLRLFILTFAFAAMSTTTHAQFSDSTKGLLMMPSAEMEKNGTLMLSNSYLNKAYLPKSGWNYSTFAYGFDITFWSRVEVAYVCTIFNGSWRPEDPSILTERQRIMRNQDRHFAARFNVIRDGDFGRGWLPSIVVGFSDPVTGAYGGEYLDDTIGEEGNGFFNRYYIAASKHLNTQWGSVGVHMALQYTKRKDFSSRIPCIGISWEPIWLNRNAPLLSSFRLVAEFDGRTANCGAITSIWNNHFDAWICLEGLKWPSTGLRYKVVIK